MRPFGDYATRGDPVSKKSWPPSRRLATVQWQAWAASAPRSRMLPLQFPSALSAQSVVRLHFLCNEPPNSTEYISERPEMTSPWRAGARECGTKAARWEAKKAKTRKNSNKIKEHKMNLKKQVIVIAVALAATICLAWGQDGQSLRAINNQTLQGTWRVTRTAIDCQTREPLSSFPSIMTFNQGGDIYRVWCSRRVLRRRLKKPGVMVIG